MNMRKLVWGSHLNCLKRWKETNKQGSVWLRWWGRSRRGNMGKKWSQQRDRKVQHTWKEEEHVTFQKLVAGEGIKRVQTLRGVMLPSFTLKWHFPWEGSAHRDLWVKTFCILEEEQSIKAHTFISYSYSFYVLFN